MLHANTTEVNLAHVTLCSSARCVDCKQIFAERPSSSVASTGKKKRERGVPIPAGSVSRRWTFFHRPRAFWIRGGVWHWIRTLPSVAICGHAVRAGTRKFSTLGNCGFGRCLARSRYLPVTARLTRRSVKEKEVYANAECQSWLVYLVCLLLLPVSSSARRVCTKEDIDHDLKYA